jgi:transketolase C-terminal domain/subunit
MGSPIATPLGIKTVVHYDGTDRGRIYLGDVGQRNQLGGGKGLYVLGQDRYIRKGQDATFITTGDVMMSALSTKGRIAKYIANGSFHAEEV